MRAKRKPSGEWLPNRNGTGRAPPIDPEGRSAQEVQTAAARVSFARKREAREEAERERADGKVPTFDEWERQEARR